MNIETARMVLRPFRFADLDDYAALSADPEGMRYFERPFTRQQSETGLRRYLEGHRRNGFHFCAVEHKPDGRFIGILGLARIDAGLRDTVLGCPEVEIGWRLARETWGRGLATEGALACLEYARLKLELSEVVAFTVVANTPSRRVMEKIGMTYDPDADFEHPSVTPGHPMRSHVLYRIRFR